MTDEDKKLIAGYMGWELPCDGNVNHAAICAIEECSLCVKCEYHHPFNLNDAGLCVQEIQKRDDWRNFLIVARKLHKLEFDSQAIAWLFIADNFFGAMAAWLKEEKK